MPGARHLLNRAKCGDVRSIAVMIDVGSMRNGRGAARIPLTRQDVSWLLPGRMTVGPRLLAVEHAIDAAVHKVTLLPEDSSDLSVSFTFRKGLSGEWKVPVPCSVGIPAGGSDRS